MQITPCQVKNLSYIVVDDLYSAEELGQIKGEIESLLPYFKTPVHTQVATDANGRHMKTGKGVFLDTHYVNRADSVILKLNRKIFSRDLIDEATKLNAFFYSMATCNADNTLINQYANGEEYRPHRDNTALTAITFFSTGNISGGDFEFCESGAIVPFRDNRTVIFPGCVLHAAQKTTSDSGSFRFSMVQLLNILG